MAAFIKGSIAFGFPLVATPLLALFIDMKEAVAISIIPNIAMDSIQASRRGGFVRTVRRLAVLLAFGVVGMVLGTRLLIGLSGPAAGGVLGAFLLLFVVWNASGLSVPISGRWERVLSPVVGFAAGVLGGLTNVPGTPMVVYFYALGMDKHEFVRSVAFSFLVYKVIQFGTVTFYGLLNWRLLAASLALTVLALLAFSIGLKVQDHLAPRTFNRIILIFLSLLSVTLLLRAFH